MSPPSPEPPLLEELQSRLQHEAIDERRGAVELLVRWAQASTDAPFDAILERLRARAGFGPHGEDDRDLRAELHRAKRSVAIARGKVRGLRAATPGNAAHEDQALVHELVYLQERDGRVHQRGEVPFNEGNERRAASVMSGTSVDLFARASAGASPGSYTITSTSGSSAAARSMSGFTLLHDNPPRLHGISLRGRAGFGTTR